MERTVQWVWVEGTVGPEGREEGRVGLGGGNGGSGWRVSMEGRLGLGGGKGACTYLGSAKKSASGVLMITLMFISAKFIVRHVHFCAMHG